MTITPVPADEAVAGAMARHGLMIGLTDLAVYVETHQDAPMFIADMNIPVPGKTRAEKVAALGAIADYYGVPVTERDGMLIAERWFGPVRLEAHIVAPDLSRRLIAAQDARKAQAA